MTTKQKDQIKNLMQDLSDKMDDEYITDKQYAEYWTSLHTAEKILKILGYTASYDNLNRVEIEKVVTK